MDEGYSFSSQQLTVFIALQIIIELNEGELNRLVFAGFMHKWVCWRYQQAYILRPNIAAANSPSDRIRSMETGTAA